MGDVYASILSICYLSEEISNETDCASIFVADCICMKKLIYYEHIHNDINDIQCWFSSNSFLCFYLICIKCEWDFGLLAVCILCSSVHGCSTKVRVLKNSVY